MNILNDFTISFSNIGIILSIIIRIITSIILLWLVIPLQIKQAQVKNGLKTLRKALLLSGLLLFLIDTVGLIIIVIRPIANSATIKLVIDIASIINSIGLFSLGILWFLIYKQQFTDKNIKLHEKVEKREKKDDIAQAKVDKKALKA